MTIPVTIRNKNPGAMWPGRASRKFGSGTAEKLSDGNKAATFPSMRHGAAAQFYLLATSKHYRGKLLAEAIKTWSGGNHVNAYLSHIEKHTDLSRGDFIDDDLITDKRAFVSLAKAMASHETGYPYPMSQAEWGEAYDLFRAVLDGEKIQEREKAGPVTAGLDQALLDLGQREIPGADDNPIIVNYFADVGRPEVTDDETAWCAAFVGSALKRGGCAYLPGALTARSYLDYGVPLEEPEVGALCVLWRVRPNSWQGHVAFVESWTPTTITLVGGNQSDSVSRITVPRTGSKSKVLGYRRAVPALTPVRDVLDSDSVRYKSGGLLAIISAMLWQTWEGLGEGAALLWGSLSGLWNDAPEIASEVTSQVSSFQTLSAAFDLPWPVYLSGVIAIAAISSNLWQTWKRKRHREDKDTYPVNVSVDVRAG